MEIVQECDLCGSSLGSARPVGGLAHLPIVECTHCGLVTTSPRPTPDEIGEHYPASYYAHVTREVGWRDRWVGTIKAYRGGYPSDDPLPARLLWGAAGRTLGGVFLTLLPYRRGGRLLDVGCGVGDALSWAADHGWEAHGVEPDAEAVRIARARGLHGVRQGTLEEQRFPDGFFDAITLYQALEHVYSPSSVLAECRRILAPHGVVYVSVPNFDSLPRRLLGGHWYALQLPVHLHHFTPVTLAAMARNAGLAVASERRYSRPISALTTFRGLTALEESAGRRAPRTRALGRLAGVLAGGGWRDLSDIMLMELTAPGAVDLPRLG